ncbi:hypothetical protein [Streptomyces sp. NPDC054961]
MGDETWTTDEFGKSHEGRAGVLLADGSVPKPVYFDGASSYGQEVRHWSVYDGGTWPKRPQAAVLRAECACGWTGPSHPINWDEIADQPFHHAGTDIADQCIDDWDHHILNIGASTIPLPLELDTLLETVTTAIENLAQDSPTAALKAARRLELIAQRTSYAPAHEARDQDPETVAAQLGLNLDQTRSLLARFGRWNQYA